jgi:hypothetical protein
VGFNAADRAAACPSRWWNLNHNDAFSAMRLDSHRNFLRLRIKDDAVTIYPIGLNRVPRRTTGLCSGVPAGTTTDQEPITVRSA